MNILLHICCAPCSIYVINQCRDVARNVSTDRVNQVTGFYFNPNIHPREEYLNRRRALEQYSKTIDMEVIYPEYEPGGFFTHIGGDEGRPERCRACWRLRLEETARRAKKEGFDAFSTTLLISPYQDHTAIKSLGERFAGELGIDFYYQDFRPGFKRSQTEAKGFGLYRQRYCGCKYSDEK